MTERNITRIGRLLLRWAEPELQRTARLLRQASDQLALIMRENIRLVELTENQACSLAALQAENQDLRHLVQQLEAEGKHHGDLVQRLEARLHQMEQKYEYMMGRVLQLQAQFGLPIGFTKDEL